MSKLTILPKQPLSAHFQHEKFIRNGTKAHFFQLNRSGIYMYWINKYSPNRDICWDICLHCAFRSSLWFLAAVTNLPNSTPCTPGAVLYLHVIFWWYKFFVHRWMKGIFFKFLFSHLWFNLRNLTTKIKTSQKFLLTQLQENFPCEHYKALLGLPRIVLGELFK